MLIALHKQAPTKPHMRAQIAVSGEPATVPARRYGVPEMTIDKWQRRTDVRGRSHTARCLQTTLNPGQEERVVHLRRTLLLPLAELLAITREFLRAEVSGCGLDRCLRCHGVGNPRALQPAPDKPARKVFKAYEPGFFVHVDVKVLPQMVDEDRRRYLFVAIDQATRWVYVALELDTRARWARAFRNARWPPSACCA